MIPYQVEASLRRSGTLSELFPRKLQPFGGDNISLDCYKRKQTDTIKLEQCYKTGVQSPYLNIPKFIFFGSLSQQFKVAQVPWSALLLVSFWVRSWAQPPLQADLIWQKMTKSLRFVECRWLVISVRLHCSFCLRIWCQCVYRVVSEFLLFSGCLTWSPLSANNWLLVLWFEQGGFRTVPHGSKVLIHRVVSWSFTALSQVLPTDGMRSGASSC